MSDPDSTRIREAVAELRGDLREAVAQLRGAIEALAAVKTGDIQRLESNLSNVRHDHKSTKAALHALHDRIDAYPKPSDIEASFSAHEAELDEVKRMAHDNQLTLARLVGLGGVGGVAAVGLLELLSRVT